MWVKVAENVLENIGDSIRLMTEDKFRMEGDGRGGLVTTTDFLSCQLVAVVSGRRNLVLASFESEMDGGEEAAKQLAQAAFQEVQKALREGQPLVDLTRVKQKSQGTSTPPIVPMPVGVSRRRA